jgi:hypothetical protein
MNGAGRGGYERVETSCLCISCLLGGEGALVNAHEGKESQVFDAVTIWGCFSIGNQYPIAQF